VIRAAAAIERLDWARIAAQLDLEGHALLPGLLNPGSVRNLVRRIASPPALRCVSLASSGLGSGELFYFDEPLPAPLTDWRTGFYHHLAPLANLWNERLNTGYRYPATLDEFLRRNRQAGQGRIPSHLNRLGEADYLALHQRNEGRHVFPLQVVALLAAPGRDFEGGEFVLTEQRPRMQSRPMVLPLKRGDAAIIGTAQRPFKGGRGYYRVNLRHAISRVRGGSRIGLELSFHDTP
jgi:hypothetical protein